MSRTNRSIVSHSHRNMKVQNRRKTECSALDIINTEGVFCRHYNRLQNYLGVIPNPWDDYPVSAHSEFDNKNYWKQYRLRKLGVINNEYE
jgi:hypothetical protein